MIPKKHQPGDLKRGDSVWYRGERFFIEWAPPAWRHGTHARICERPIPPDRPGGSDLCYRNEKGEGTGAPFMSFCVHVDALTTAPPVSAIALVTGGGTFKAAERKERLKKGLKDVGDPVAQLLRESKDIYATGSDFLGVPQQELKRKYGHLNAGQQRMNIGNRMRAKWKKENR